MTRPIVWALGMLATAALSATTTSDRLAARLGLAGSPSPGAPASAAAGQVLAISADLRGHFIVHPALNGQRVRMLVDTGASLVALRSEDAAAIGIRPQPREFNRPTSTANGTVMVAPVRIREMRVGDITVHDVEAVVVPAGRLGTNLLGMSFLRRLKGFEMASGRLTLKG